MKLSLDLETDKYLDFIQELRDKAKDSNRVSHGRPVLPLQEEAEGQCIDVNFRIRGSDKGTLTIRRYDLCLMGYHNLLGFSWLDGTVFDLYDTNLLDLGFVVRPSALGDAVNFLADLKKDLLDLEERDALRSSLLVLRVLLCEAAKFDVLSCVFDNVFKYSFEVPLHSWMLKLITEWEDLSKALLGPYHDDKDDCNYYLAGFDNSWDNVQRRVIGVTCQDLASCLGILHGRLPTIDDEMIDKPIKGTMLVEIYSVLVHFNGGRSGCIYGTIEVGDATWTKCMIYQRSLTECEHIESDDTLTLEGPSDFINANDSFEMEFDLKEKDTDLQICQGRMYWSNSFICRNDDLLETRHSVLVKGQDGYAIVFYTVFRKAVLATVEATLVWDNGLGTSDGASRFICVNGSLVARSNAFIHSTKFEQKYYQTKLFNKLDSDQSPLHQCTPDMGVCKLGKIIELGAPMPLSRSVVAVHADYKITIEAALRNSAGDLLVAGSVDFDPQEAGISKDVIRLRDSSYSLLLKVSWKYCSYA